MQTHRNNERGNNERGVTMLELLVVLAIGAILLTMAIPSFQRTKYHLEVQGAAQTLVTDLRTTQADAIRQGTTYGLAQTANPPAKINGASQSLVDFCGANRCILEDGGGTSTDHISFDSNGYVSFPAVMPFSMTLKACQTEETLKVQVERTGRIQTLTLTPSAC